MLEYIPTVTSTNDIAMEYGKNGVQEDIIIVSNCQTKGRGRKGRKFY